MKGEFIKTRVAGAALALLLAPPVLAQEAWVAERVTGKVSVELDGSRRSLEDGQRLPERGSVELQDDAALTLWRANVRLRTRGPSFLGLHGSPGGEARIARLHVGEGAFRIEAPENADLRINVGGLRVRLSGGEAWLAADPDADRVCALRGSVEVQPPDATHTLIMRQTGACLALHADGSLEDERPLLHEINERLARADGGSSPLPVTFQTPPLPTRRADRPQAAATAAAPEPAPPAGEHFYVILGAFSDQARAQAALGGLDHPRARVLRSDDARLWRLAIGPFTDRVEANRERSAVRRQYADSWILVVSDSRR